MSTSNKKSVVVRVALPIHIWEEFANIAVTKHKSANYVIRSMLVASAEKKIKEREELDAIFKVKHFANTGERL